MGVSHCAHPACLFSFYPEETVKLTTLLAVFLTGLAQITIAAVYGSVRDATDGTAAGVTIQLTNEQTGVQQRATTTEIGEFAADFLPIGSYTVVVEAPGFKTFRQRSLTLNAGQQIRYPITLEVGDISQSVEIT